MKIALIYPNFLNREAYPPLGIAYLGTYLKKRGHSVSLLDATFYEGYDRLSTELKNSSPDVVGLSFTSPLESFAYKCAAISKQLFPHVPVIAGGPHPTIQPKETLSQSCIDMVVIGEGEFILNQILRNIEKGEGTAEIPGAWSKNQQNNVLVQGAFIEDLDSIPYPDWDMFPNLTDYIKYSDNIFPVLSGRGCPFHCSFCQPTLERLFGRRLRRRSPENVIEEIIQLKKREAKGFLFQDDTFTIGFEWVKKFCDLLMKNRINLPWTCNSRIDTINEDMLVLMEEAGLKKIAFGVESGSNRILKEVLKKNTTLEKIREVFHFCHKHNILANAFIMLGSPSENIEDIKQTIKLIKQIKPNWVSCTRTVLLPETDLWDYAQTRDLILDRKQKNFSFHYADYSSQTHKLNFPTSSLRNLKNRLYLEWALATMTKKPIHKLFLIFFALLGIVSPKFAKILGENLGKRLWVPPVIYS